MVNFEWYRSFIAVYRSGTVTAAADARALTQPAISQHIATLEAIMQQSLFQRTARRMIPTAVGQQLYSRLAPALDGLENLSQQLQPPLKNSFPGLKLGVLQEYFGEIALARLSSARLRLQVELGDTGSLIESLMQGRLDLAIVSQHLGNKELDYVKIDAEEFVLVAPAALECPRGLGKRTPSEVENFLLMQDWISYAAELPIIRRFWHISFHHRPAIEPRMVVPNLLLMRKAVELGMGISILPRYLCTEALKAKRLKILWQPALPVQNDLWVASRKVDRHRPEIKTAVDFLKRLS
ncbi:MAG: LysR family transcriptional regulator [Pseudomonadota bacterium]